MCGDVVPGGTTLFGVKEIPKSMISLKGDSTIQFQNYVEEKGPVIQISKRDAVGSEEGAGAMLKLTGKDGLDLSDVVISGGATVPAGPSQDKSTIIWESGETPAALKNLPDGTYTLEETVAPDGYTLVKSTFEFTIKDGKVEKTDGLTSDEFSFEKKAIFGYQQEGSSWK